MASKQDHHTDLAFLNDGLDARTEYRFYWKRDLLCISFYIGADRRQRACSIVRPEVVDAEFRAAARRRAAEIALGEKRGRVLEATVEDRVQTAATLEELVAAWKKAQVEKYPDSWKTRHIQINNVARVVTESASAIDATPLQCIVDDRGPQLFLDARMRQVLKDTVKKEVGILFSFLEWLKDTKRFITEIPPRPKYRKKARGIRVGFQRAESVHLPDETALRIIMLLPEHASRGGRKDVEGSKLPERAFVCRDWMRFSFEVSLRPSTVAKLETGKHWVRGNHFVKITPDIDKGGNVAQEGKPRNVPLTEVAFAILMKHAPAKGLIFGKHDIRIQWKRAAKAVLGEEEGSRCSPYDLRHGANFRMRSTVGGSLGGAMHMTGHALATTNDLYMKQSEAEAQDIVALLDKRNAELEKKLARGRRETR